MSIISVAEFKAWAKKHDGDPAVETLYQEIIDAAEDIVSLHLGYSPQAADYAHTFFGDGKCYLQLKAQPINSITSISVDGVVKDPTAFSWDRETIVEKAGELFPEGSVIVVTYNAGFSAIPALIKLVIKEIASKHSAEIGENNAVSSVSYDGGNTRSFINYSDFRKELGKIEGYRIRALRREFP